MLDLICLNGRFQSQREQSLSPDNRAFLYGDGLFESIRISEGNLLFFDDHFERLIASMYVMGFDNTFFDPLKVFGEMEELIRRNQCKEGRLRLNVFRNSGGFYKPLTDQCSYLMTIQTVPEVALSINEKGLRLGLYSEIRKPLNALSGIKSASALLYVMAARQARESGWDDALILNEYGRICECSAANIFLLMPDKTIVTPALSEGILPGVMRKNLIRFMRENEMVVEERMVMTDDLFKADEIFLSNAIQGIQWVISFRERRYFSTFSRRLAELMQQELIQAS